jgi:hypothetical protein
VDNLQEQLTGARVEDKDGTVDRLSRQVAFEGLVNSDSIDIRVVDEQLYLVREELRVIL